MKSINHCMCICDPQPTNEAYVAQKSSGEMRKTSQNHENRVLISNNMKITLQVFNIQLSI